MKAMFKIWNQNGHSLTEALVGTLSLGIILVGFMRFMQSGEKQLKTVDQGLDRQEISLGFKAFFNNPDNCYNFFLETVARELSIPLDDKAPYKVGQALLDINNQNREIEVNPVSRSYFDKSINPKNRGGTKTIYALNSFQLKCLPYAGVGTNNCAGNPNGVPLIETGNIQENDATEYFVQARVKVEGLARTRGHSSSVFSLSGKEPYTFSFWFKKLTGDIVFHGCHLQDSSYIGVQKQLCSQIGGVFRFDGCKFRMRSPLTNNDSAPANIGEANEVISENSGNPEDYLSFSEVMCELEKRVVFIENAGVPHIWKSDTDDDYKKANQFTLAPDPQILIRGVPRKSAVVTKYCKVPQGRWIDFNNNDSVIRQYFEGY